ncbi:MAG: ATP-binding cassette domain-containing protein [Deltaproteobacteria bacterium]|nr:MAG: ATP-binding cassette domain-containing protein [Deltaproteobacteria bacterium]
MKRSAPSSSGWAPSAPPSRTPTPTGCSCCASTSVPKSGRSWRASAPTTTRRLSSGARSSWSPTSSPPACAASRARAWCSPRPTPSATGWSCFTPTSRSRQAASSASERRRDPKSGRRGARARGRGARPGLRGDAGAGGGGPHGRGRRDSRTPRPEHESFCYPDLSGAENLAFHARLFDVAAARERIGTLLAWAGLEAAGRRPVRFYSRGMSQRLALARALLHEPDLLLLDEPFSGLDPAAVEALQERLVALREAGRAIVLTTHDLDRAAPIATRTAILHRGRIASVLDGRAADAVAAAYRAVVAGGR